MGFVQDDFPGAGLVYPKGEEKLPLAKNAEAKATKEAKRRTKWSVLKGYHLLRHSFISALANKGIDQRIIDELVGHQTEAMQRRYRHLYPQIVANGVKQVLE
jgi:site-specific recombinase XerD